MAITDHTRKVLWSLAGNACARCGASLVHAPEAVGDPHAVIGRECHIIARSSRGPRGESGVRDDIDGCPNLILLCANCHAVVDGQPERFPPDELQRLKSEHEARIAQSVNGGLPELHLEGRDVPIQLTHIDDGDALIRILGPSLSISYETPSKLSSSQRSSSAQFLQDCTDWGDIVGDLGPRGYFDAGEILQGHLENLAAEGLVVYAATRHLTLSGGRGRSPWPEAMLCVVHEEDARALPTLRNDHLVLNIPAHWRIPPSFSDLSPFGMGCHGRSLRIVVDHEHARAGPALDLLRAFARRPGLEIYSTEPAAPRRIEFGANHVPHDAIEVRYVLPEGSRSAALYAATSWERHARVEAEETGLDLIEIHKGLLLAQAAARHQVDALVTSTPILAMPRWSGHARNAHLTTPEEACALVGLFLRAHNDFTVQVEGNHNTFLEFERFYHGAATAALPSYLGWLHVAWTLWRDGRGPEPFKLTRAVQARIGRALVARDYVSVRSRHWRPDETWGEALYFFESFLLSLHGAIDAFARLVHVALDLSPRKRGAGFQHRAWRRMLVASASSPPLAKLLEADAPFIAAVESIGVLRNFVHAEALSEELLHDDGGPAFIDHGKGVLVLHGESAERLTITTERAGGAARWGLANGFNGAVTIMPITFLRQALLQGLTGIEAIMATQVLAGTVTRLATPFDPEYWLSTRRYSDALLLLTGLSASAE